MHRPVAALEDVVFIDLGYRIGRYRPAQGLLFDPLSQFVPFAFLQLFAVVQVGIAETRRKHNGGGEYGAGQAAPAGLVATGFQLSICIIRE